MLGQLSSAFKSSGGINRSHCRDDLPPTKLPRVRAKGAKIFEIRTSARAFFFLEPPRPNKCFGLGSVRDKIVLTKKGKYGLKAMVHLAGLEPNELAQVADIVPIRIRFRKSFWIIF